MDGFYSARTSTNAGASLDGFLTAAHIAGVLTAHSLRGVTPDDYTIWISATVVAMMVLGGRGTIVGPILGAVFLVLMPEALGKFAEYKMLIYGIMLVLAINLMPEGVIGRLRRRFAR